MSKGRRLRLRPRGQALVELALVLPLLVVLLLAVFDIGRAVFLYNGLTNAAREGARLAIVNQDEAMVAHRVQDAAFGSAITNLDDLVGYYRQSPNTIDVTQNDECTTMATGCIAVVIARSDWSAITPVIGSLMGPIEFTARSELPVELVCPNPTYDEYLTSDRCPRQP